jgi:hypothetical protein
MQVELPTSPPTSSSALLRVLKAESFIEKVLLLAITAILSGVLIPLAIKSIDSEREGRAALARAQAKLFDDVSETILTTETLILDVSWYGTVAAKNPDLQNKAFERYNARVVDLIGKWRAESSRAQALASPKVSEKIHAFLGRFFVEQDTPMNSLWADCGTSCEPKQWEERHLSNEELLGEANALVLELASDLGLARK